MKTPARMLLPLALLALPAFAGFSSTTQELKLAYGQKTATVEFATDDGSRITKAKPLCDCTTLRVEGSRLIAQVDTSTFDASVDKQIDVTTSDGTHTTLTMRFIVPPAIELNTPSLVWERGSAPTPQEFRIRIPEGSPVRALREAGLSGDAFSYRASTISPGREYAITVTPKSTARRALNRLVIKMDSSSPLFSQRILYIRVR